MKILIIDDERSIRNTLKEILEFEGNDVAVAADGKEGLDMATANSYDAIFCDIKMPGMDGIEVLGKMEESGVDTPIIMISGHGSIDTAVDCIKKGAFDFIQKPLDLNRILITLKNATDKSSLVKETKILKKKVEKVAKVPEIVGESPAILKIKEMIDRVASTDARVLVTGSNGTGKELVARWLHEKSNRSSMPFIEVNCAAIPGELIESELFGHVKGSFTGAVKDHKGKFEQADGGTLFLDEIGDMSLSAQAKVLRVLQENKLSRVGSDKDINVKVRVVAATNKNLLEEIEKGNFREDLYHRLSVIVIKVPSLSERREDIPLLVRHFINQICNETGMPQRSIDADAIAELQKYPWTGNIRELRNVTERLLILSNATINKDDVIAYASPLFK
jgi:Response regulator containing CheY-like receiver, AAA-type ATPase, and DNA-binding domains